MNRCPAARRTFALAAFSLAMPLALSFAPAAQAAWPEKPVRLVVTSAAGGASIWTLADDAGKTMLNGKRWMVDDKQPVCQ